MYSSWRTVGRSIGSGYGRDQTTIGAERFSIARTRLNAAIAEVFNAQMAPHLYAGPVEWAANIQLSVAIPNLLIAETIETPFHDALIKSTIRVEDGFVPAPDAPGLGIEVDEALARAHPLEETGLHLEMQEDPPRYDAPQVFEGGAPGKTGK